VKQLLYATAAIATLALPLAGTVSAQDRTMTKTLTGEQKTVTATVEAIERSTRSVTLKEANGDYNEVYVPAAVKRFDTLKVGDKVTAKYYENIVLRLKAPGEASKDTDTAALTPGTGAKAGGTAATQRTITATINHIDANVPSISFTGPKQILIEGVAVDAGVVVADEATGAPLGSHVGQVLRLSGETKV
jgi:hypothetical protein